MTIFQPILLAVIAVLICMALWAIGKSSKELADATGLTCTVSGHKYARTPHSALICDRCLSTPEVERQ